VVRLAFWKPLFVLSTLCAALRGLGYQSAVFSLPPPTQAVEPDFL